MQIEAKELFSQSAGPCLQLKRPILTIDEYAAREGISREIVEEYRKMGIVQIRKYKDKMFVVDIPMGTYSDKPDASDKAGVENRLKNRQSELEMAKPAPDKPVKKIHRTTSSAGKINLKDNSAELIPTPELEKRKITDEPKKFVYVTAEEPMPSLAEFLQRIKSNPDVFDPRTWSKRVWQIVTCSLLAVLFAVLYASFWFQVGREAQLDRFIPAGTEFRQFGNVSGQAEHQVPTKRESNSEAIEKLNEQIERLRTQLAGLSENGQTFSGPGRR